MLDLHDGSPTATDEHGTRPFLDWVGLHTQPIEGYRCTLKFEEEDVLEGAGPALTDVLSVLERLIALGLTVRSVAGAPEAFGANDLWSAVVPQDIEGLRSTYGGEYYIATRPIAI